MSDNLVREIQDRQTQVSRRLAQIQQQLYKLEDQYLDATQIRGNIIRGWEGYLDYKTRSSQNANNSKYKDKKLKSSERIFSFSSITAPIPKSELDKDEETPVALKWAEEYELAMNPPPQEVATSAASGTTSTTNINATKITPPPTKKMKRLEST